eukprot:PhM_4_TR4460/c0_g2_i1/m.92786
MKTFCLTLVLLTIFFILSAKAKDEIIAMRTVVVFPIKPNVPINNETLAAARHDVSVETRIPETAILATLRNLTNGTNVGIFFADPWWEKSLMSTLFDGCVRMSLSDEYKHKMLTPFLQQQDVTAVFTFRVKSSEDYTLTRSVLGYVVGSIGGAMVLVSAVITLKHMREYKHAL